MKPILFTCSFFTIYTYGVFVAIAFFVSTFLISAEVRQKNGDENLFFNLCLFILISGIVFARLFYVVLNWDVFKGNPLEIIMLQHGGLVWFGGFSGALVSGLVFFKIKKMPVLETLDLLIPYVALGQAIGRIGCFFNGCCYGKAWSLGFYFPVHHAFLFPTQLLDSFSLLAIFVFLRSIAAKTKQSGIVLAFSFILMGLQRFFMEFIRADERPYFLLLSIFQWISAGLFFLGIFSLGAIFLWKKKAA